ncbi:efflux RND transporter permease subunit [Thalassoglobus polymorphus]|nr:efflux RND transporter permease subunit [Thalassoglobus polymorphus]
MSRPFNRVFGWTLDHRWLTLLLLSLMSGIAFLGYYSPSTIRSLFESAPEQVSKSESERPKEIEQSPDVEAIELAKAEVVLVIDSEDFFTKESSQGLRKVVEAIESLDYIDDVLWMDSAPPLNLFGLREPILPKPSASERQFDLAKERALNHPLIGGQFLSEDGKTTLLMLSINWLFVERDEDVMDGLKAVSQNAVEDLPGVDFSFLVTGRVPMYLTFYKANQTNRIKYQAIGYTMVLLMAIILFRGIRAVLIVSIAPILGVFWSLGVIRFFDFANNPFNDVVLPVMLSLVGLTDGVHLMVEIRRQRAAGLSEKEAARAGIHKVGLACALTSLTTAIGFGSLSLAHHEIVREFGWSCVMGVILTFFAVITSIPLACSTWLGGKIHHGHEKGIIDRNLHHISGVIDFVLRWPKVIGTIGILLTILLASISLTLSPDEKQITSLPTGSEASRALLHMDKAFGGLEQGRIDINWSEKVNSKSPAVLEVVGKVTEVLENEDLIGTPVSISKLVDALPGEGEVADRVSLIELLPPPLKRAFFTPEQRHATVQFRVQDLGIARYSPVFERVKVQLAQLKAEYPEFVFKMSGSAVWRWENLYQIVVDLATSLGSASIIILIVLGISYRSLRLGLISIVPNMFPLAVTGAALALTGHTLEVVSVCAFTVCLGIAVDDTIHFLTRYLEEGRTARTSHDAIRKAFIGTGTALIMTTLVLDVGFATVLFSDMRDQQIFGAMAGITITAALFGDLVFLPALLSMFGVAPKRDQNSSASDKTI